MTPTWQPKDSDYSYRHASGDCSITVTAGEETVIRLARSNAEIACLTVGQVEFKSAAMAHCVSMEPNEAVVRGAALELPQQSRSTTGLCGAIRIVAENDGLTVESRIQTVEPVENLTLNAFLDLSADGIWFPVAGKTLEKASLVVASIGEERLAVLADLRDLGLLDVDRKPVGHRLRYAFFRRPLEKGVILVARFALRVVDRQVTDDNLSAWRQLWLEQRGFL